MREACLIEALFGCFAFVGIGAKSSLENNRKAGQIHLPRSKQESLSNQSKIKSTVDEEVELRSIRRPEWRHRSSCNSP
jgi:hypothetical protein